jgi:DnaJ-class molecular chaperone
MKKVRNYTNLRVETCRNCKGAGTVMPKLAAFALGECICKPTRCPVCGGSGWIQKTANIEITIEPHKRMSNKGQKPHKTKKT